jgi:serine O-acetyltransferase
MKDKKRGIENTCSAEEDILAGYRRQLPRVAQLIIESCNEQKCNTHVDYEPIPSKESVIKIIDKFLEIIFPGFFNAEKLDPVNLSFHIGQSVTQLFSLLSEQMISSIRHDCFRYNLSCQECIDKGCAVTLKVLEAIPSIRDTLAEDVQAAYDGDPAARSFDEIIFSYPGIFAISVYRLAHVIYGHDVPLLPRIMTEYAHGRTGIDIHPGAKIGKCFVIDHGTGVVIGETTTIGKDVRIYQGVTIGALSLPKDAGEKLRGKKRHPDIEDGVIIYSGATILGGDTTIGARSVIGGNVWLTESVPPDTQVIMENPQLIYKKG